jgi:hypothetical protein
MMGQLLQFVALSPYLPQSKSFLVQAPPAQSLVPLCLVLPRSFVPRSVCETLESADGS